MPPQKQSIAVPVLVALCSALAVVLIGVGLMATGVIRLGGQEQTTPQATTQVSSGSAKRTAEGSTAEETEISNDGSSTTTSSVSSSSSSAQAKSGSSSSSVVSQPQQKPTIDTSNETPEPVAAQQSSEYVLPNSSTYLYSADELASLSDWELYIARNEIYARHGRGFVRQDLTDYFENCSWYTKLYEPEYFDANIGLSDVETANAETILDIEHNRGSPYV